MNRAARAALRNARSPGVVAAGTSFAAALLAWTTIRDDALSPPAADTTPAAKQLPPSLQRHCAVAGPHWLPPPTRRPVPIRPRPRSRDRQATQRTLAPTHTCTLQQPDRPQPQDFLPLPDNPSRHVAGQSGPARSVAGRPVAVTAVGVLGVILGSSASFLADRRWRRIHLHDHRADRGRTTPGCLHQSAGPPGTSPGFR